MQRKFHLLYNIIMYRYLFAIFTLLLSSVLPQSVCAQTEENGVPFNGIITDIANKPIKGAKIYIVDDSFYARSDKEGKFGLTNVQPNDTLHVKYKKEIYDVPVEGRKSIRIHLGDQLEANEDDDLVAFGYGFVKRRESIQPSSGIPGEVLRRQGKSSLVACLAGLVPGMNVSPDGKIVIRGINTIHGSTDPLFIVDGTEVLSLDFLNVYDVDHVEVLKDASIYGARGANGAILVFTKRN